MSYTKAQIETIQASLDSVSEHDLEAKYCETLDEQGPVTIAGYQYEQSHALRAVDPTAYRCGLADWISFELDERLTEIEGEYYETEAIEDLIESLTEGV